MSLRERLIAEIAEAGPMPVAAFMTRCLHDPRHGYYATRPRLGAEGDFITAPHVSQMFGELIGLWAAEVWGQLGAPSRLRLIELGPGDGTMMADVLRAVRAAPGFLDAAEVWLVETSAPLRARQADALAGRPVQWADRLEDIADDAPVILLANEFLDCLPVSQFVNTEHGWRERVVGLDACGQLSFGVAPSRPFSVAGQHPLGTVLSLSPPVAEAGRAAAALIARASGAALFIDYGGQDERFGDSLQALRGHRKEGALEHPGEADLTARVDFSLFLGAAGGQSALTTQGGFLRALGIETRAAALARANPARAEAIGRQLGRLADDGEMGALFKVAGLWSPGLAPPGFAA